MEHVKTDIDKIFDKFTESPSLDFVKRLSFDYLNHFSESKPTKKRKLSEECNESSSSLNSSNVSAPPSPWESRRIKADLLEANSRITQLKKVVDQQNTVRANMEMENKQKNSTLEKELKHKTEKIKDLEKHLLVVRKREHVQRLDFEKCKSDLDLQKQSYEEQLYSLNRRNADLEDTVRQITFDMNKEITDLNLDRNELYQALSVTQDKLELQNTMNEELTNQLQKYTDLETRAAEATKSLAAALTKITELEFEISNYNDWKIYSKDSENRVADETSVELELIQLRQENMNLRKTIGNTLLLEEQVQIQNTQLENFAKNNIEACSLKVKIESLEEELREWQKLCRDHCGPKAVLKSTSLRARIEQILERDLVLAIEKPNKVDNQISQNEVIELKTKNNLYLQQYEDTARLLQNHKNFVVRLQKKLHFVVKERDLFKQLIENYEKDLTITSTSFVGNPDSQLRCRIEMLEKTLAGYKEMCAKQEEELKVARNLPDLCNDPNLNGEQYDRFRKELEAQRIENEKLRFRKDELELELERKTMNGNESRIDHHRNKVLHFSMNPASEAYKEHENKVEKLQAEIERLKSRNRKLEEGNDELTVKLNDTNFTINVKEVNNMRTQMQSLEAKNQHLKEIYKAASQEFREVCYMLFGYRVDRHGNSNYRVSSMYAESPEEYLNFRLNESGVLDMLETEYSESLGEMMRMHLGTHNSLPAFLSALTLDLINKTTVVV